MTTFFTPHFVYALPEPRPRPTFYVYHRYTPNKSSMFSLIIFSPSCVLSSFEYLCAFYNDLIQFWLLFFFFFFVYSEPFTLLRKCSFGSMSECYGHERCSFDFAQKILEKWLRDKQKWFFGILLFSKFFFFSFSSFTISFSFSEYLINVSLFIAYENGTIIMLAVHVLETA